MNAIARSTSPAKRLQETSNDNVSTCTRPAATSGFKRRRTLSTNLGDKRRPKIIRAPQPCFLSEITLDILFEIFSYLEPLDILRLSRTCKDARSLLLERSSSAFLWRRALCNVEGLPELPSDLTEVGYANLAFSASCHICLVSRCEKVFWECRIRCCKRCFPSIFVKDTELQADPSYSVLVSHKVSHLVPKVTVHGRWQRYCFKIAIDRLCTELLQLKGEAEIETWKSDKELQKRSVHEHATQCEVWERDTKVQRAEERRKLRKIRLDSVKERLSGIGWGGEIQRLDLAALSRFRRLRGVNSAHALSDNAWTKVKPVVVEFLLRHRSARWDTERRRRYDMLKDRYTEYENNAVLADLGIRPRLGDVLMSKDFRTIIEETSFDQHLSIEAFDPAFIRLSVFTNEWRIEKEMELYAMLCDAVPETRSISDLCRATTVFKCNAVDCGELLCYPDMLEHPCSTSCSFRAADGSSEFSSPQAGQDSASFDPCLFVGSRPWNEGKNRLVFCDSASRIAMQILGQSAMDPHSTVELVQLWNPVIMCETCHDGECMSWKEALQHDESHSLITRSVGYDAARIRFGISYDLCNACGMLVRPDLFSHHLSSVHHRFNVTE